MAALTRGLVTALAATAASVLTFATIGHVHPPAPVRIAAATPRPGTTGPQVIDPSFYARPADAPPDTSRPAVSRAVQPAEPGSGVAPPPPAPAPPPLVVGSTQQALINSDRAAAGLPPLAWSPCLAGIAAAQSRAMAGAGRIYHGSGVNQDFGCGLGSTQAGENVGYWSAGINDSQLNTLFMNSADHRANIMGPYHYVGTAWVVAANGYGYISVEFG